MNATLDSLLRDLHSADAALASVRDAVIQTDHDDSIVRVNRAAEALTGVVDGALVGRPLGHTLDLGEPDGEAITIRRGQPLPDGVFRVLRLPDGGERLVLVSTTAHDHGRIYVIRDLAADAAMRSGHDSLTGLPDRQLLEQRLEELLAAPGADGRQLIYIDLDQFKVVNDLCGHRAGDQLLCQLTAQWQAVLEHGELLARLGGDEFCAVLKRGDLAAAATIGERLIDIAQELRFEWDGQVFRIGASAGLVDFAVAGGADALLAAADSACWAAKEAGRNRLHIYRAGDREMTLRHEQMGWLARIARAIDESRLVLHHQRIVPLDGVGRGHSEILVRMLADDGSLVAPDLFVPAAERFNLMPRLDRWVIEQVFVGLAGQADPDPVAINISGTTFNDTKFIDFVCERFARHGVPSGVVTFELTETAAIRDIERARAFIAAMHELGCSISLDDFGSGVSSFAYLKSLDVDYLKIDGAFIRNIERDEVDFAMVEAINKVGAVMGIPTIAEFVEDAGIAARLRRIGVRYGQGYAFHAPERWRSCPELAMDLVVT